MTNPPLAEQEIFFAAIEILDLSERTAYLDRACAKDPELRKRLNELLKAHGASGGPFDAQSLALTIGFDPLTEPILTDKWIGPYKLLQPIGEGGMGVVYMAEQYEPLKRRVALKVIRPGMDTRQIVARFEAERQALALMDHPNIARVLDAGVTTVKEDEAATGQPYFVMELVYGKPITKYCDEQSLQLHERMELFSHVCLAVHHAHQKGIVHRDLKPTNILVTTFDGKPLPKVIDFGVAKAMQDRLTQKTLYTEFGHVIGTLEYMSPEQARLDHWDIDTRSDIYSLGVILYEMLSGELPIDGARLRSAAFDERLRMIREDDPPTPSRRVSESRSTSSIAEKRQVRVERLTSELRGEPDWIVMKCLEKDRTRRYDSAASLAADLQRYLAHEPILARPASSWYVMQKFAKRHRTLVTAVLSIALAVTVGLAVATSLWLRERETRRRALRAEQMATTEAQRATRVAEQSRQRSLRLQVAAGARLLEEGDLHRALPWFAEAYKTDYDHAENAPLHRLRLASVLQQSPRPMRIMAQQGSVAAVAFSPDGKLLVTATKNGQAAVWDVSSGRQIAAKPFPNNAGSAHLKTSFSVDGSKAMVEGDQLVIVWDLGQAEPVATIIHPSNGFGSAGGGPRRQAALSKNGQMVVIADDTPTLQLWDANDGHKIREWDCEGEDVRVMTTITGLEAREVLSQPASADDAQILLAVDKRGVLYAWDLASGSLLEKRPLGQSIGISSIDWGEFSRDGKIVVTLRLADANFAGQLIDVKSGRLNATLSHSHRVHNIAFSPDGETIATACQDRLLRIWNTRTGAPRCSPIEHPEAVQRISISPGGQMVASASDDRVRVWSTFDGKPIGPPLMHSTAVRSVMFGRDDATIVTGCSDGSLRIWSLAAAPKWKWVGTMPSVAAGHSLEFYNSYVGAEWGEALVTPDGVIIVGRRGNEPLLVRVDTNRLTHVETNRDQTWLMAVRATSTGASELIVFSTETAQSISVATPIAGLIGFSANGARAITSVRESSVQVIETLTGKPVGDAMDLLPGSKASLSPNGDILSIEHDDKVVLVRVDDKTRRRLELTDEAGVTRPQWSPDGQKIVTSSAIRSVEGDYFAKIWDTATGDPLPRVLDNQSAIGNARFSSDGLRVVTPGGDGRTRVWNANTGTRLSSLTDATRSIDAASFGLHDRAVVAACADGTARIWDALTGDPLIPPLRHGTFEGAVGALYQDAMLLCDGNVLYTFCTEPRHWVLPRSDLTLEQWQLVAHTISSRQLDANERLEPIDRKALLELWERAHQQAPSAFQRTDEQLYDWHLWRAEISLSEFNFEGALPHLHYLISVDPNRIRFRDMRAFAYEALEQWEEMAADLYVAASVNPNDLSCWLRIAVAELSAGKTGAFRAATAQIAASILPRHELDLVSRASFVCCMGPSVSPETLEVLKSKLSLVRHELYDRCTYERAMAMIDFRQGNYEAVIRAADEGAIGAWRADPFFVAMAHHHLGHAEQAKSWLEKLAGMEMKRVYAATFIYPAAVGVYRALEAEMRTVIPSTRD